MTPDFDWDDDNLEKVARHGITLEEIEAVFADPSRLSVPAYRVQGERRRAIVGATDEGRILFIVFTVRRGLARVVTAYEAGDRDRRRYRRRRR